MQLKRINPKIIGVTGSVGKTSTAAAIYTILSSKFKVHYNEHANTESGIPLDILGIQPKNYSMSDWLRMVASAPLTTFKFTPDYQIYIAEMGIDAPFWPKNMDFLLWVIQPIVGVFLNARLVHSQNFKNLEEIATEKGKLIRSLPANGVAIINIDDDYGKELSLETVAGQITYGKSKDAMLTIKDVEIDMSGFKLKFSYENKDYLLNFKDRLFNFEYGEVFLPAIGVGIALGMEIPDIIHTLESNYQTPPGRMTKLAGIKGSIILDSSYNASKSAVLAALEVIRTIGKNSRKIAVLGDMRELGDNAEIEHKEIAKASLEAADLVITVGPLTNKYFPEKVQNFTNSYKAGEYLRGIIKKGDVILFKGSQNTIFLEQAVEIVMANPKEADKVLCRRGEFWDKKRRETC